MADERTEKQKVKEITHKLEQGLKELLSGVDGYTDFVQELTTVSYVSIGFEDIPGDSKGYFHMGEKRIAIQENMSESQTLKNYDDGYDDIYMDGDFDYDRYNNDSGYADGVDDAMDEFGEDW